MPIADAETRARLYAEYVALSDEFRNLADRLKPFATTPESRVQFREFADLAKRLEAKLHELQEASAVRRTTPAPGSMF